MSSQYKAAPVGDAVPDLIVRPLQSSETDAAADLIARCFARGDARRYERLLYERLRQQEKPGFQPEHYHGGFIDNRLVSVAHVEQRLLSYGSVMLKVAGIGDVCTDPAYRHRGYSGAVMRDTIAAAAGQGAHLALLHDRSDYYLRFGFTPVWPEYGLQFAAPDLSEQTPPLAVRPAQLSDAPALMALYERHWQGRAAFRRSPDLWMWRLSHETGLLVAGTPELAGYWWQHPEHESAEVVADTPEAALTLMIAAAQQAHSSHIVRWAIPPDDTLAAFAGLFTTVTLSATYRPHGGWMARMIQPAEMVGTLLPEIIAQASAADPALDSHQLRLEVQPDEVLVGIRQQPRSLCRLSHRDFMQVLFGSLRPTVLALRARLTPPQVALLEMLFPPRMAALAAWDWF